MDASKIWSFLAPPACSRGKWVNLYDFSSGSVRSPSLARMIGLQRGDRRYWTFLCPAVAAGTLNNLFLHLMYYCHIGHSSKTLTLVAFLIENLALEISSHRPILPKMNNIYGHAKFLCNSPRIFELYRKSAIIQKNTDMWIKRGRWKRGTGKRGTMKFTGVENAGLENEGPNRKGGKRRTGKRGTKFAGVEKAGQACMEREMTKNRSSSLINNLV